MASQRKRSSKDKIATRSLPVSFETEQQDRPSDFKSPILAQSPDEGDNHESYIVNPLYERPDIELSAMHEQGSHSGALQNIFVPRRETTSTPRSAGVRSPEARQRGNTVESPTMRSRTAISDDQDQLFNDGDNHSADSKRVSLTARALSDSSLGFTSAYTVAQMPGSLQPVKGGKLNTSIAFDGSAPNIRALDSDQGKELQSLRSARASNSTIGSTTGLMTGHGRVGSIMKMAGVKEVINENENQNIKYSRVVTMDSSGETPNQRRDDTASPKRKQRILVRTGKRFLIGHIRKSLESDSFNITSSTGMNSAQPLNKIKCTISGHGSPLHLAPSSFVVIPTQHWSSRDPLRVGEPIIARIVNEEYALATVLGGYKEKILVQFVSGGCNLVAPSDIIRNLVLDAEKLPIIKLQHREARKIATIAAFLSAVEIALAVLLLFVKLPSDYTMKDDGWLNTIQTAVAVLTALICVKCLYLSYSVTVDFSETTKWFITYKMIVLCFFDVLSLSAASIPRALLTGGGMLLRIGQLTWLHMHPKMVSHYRRMRREIQNSFQELRHRHLEMTNSRGDTLYRKNMVSWKFFGTLSITFTIFLGVVLGLELWRLITNQNPMLNLEQLGVLRQTVAGEQERQGVSKLGNPTGLKAFLVILDGMRADHLQSNKDFKDLLQDPSIKNDLMVAPMMVQLPSMSVPNWLTFITGSPPWMTGVIGNAAVQLSSFDSIFSLAFTSNRTTGLTGSSWFGDLVESYLDLTSMGTNDAGFGYQQGVANSQFADTQRENAVEQIVSRRQQYEFYLAHFSDIDERGHLSGVTREYNELDTYNKAVSDKAQILRNVFTNIGNDTVVIVVADHGHVDSGGHGGTNPVLMNTFMLTYMKSSNLGRRALDPFNPFNSVDVAPTICALLGLPMPANNIGRIRHEISTQIITSLNQDEALYQWEAQQRGLRQVFDSMLGTSFYTQALGNGTLDTSKDFSEAVSNAYRKNVVPNVLLLTLYAILMFIALCAFVTRTTGVDSPARLLIKALYQTKFGKGRRAATDVKRTNSQDGRAFKIAVLLVAAYHCITFVVYIVGWRMKGKYDWDSTTIHHPNQMVIMALLTFIPGAILEYIIARTITYRCQFPHDSLPHTYKAAPPEEPDLEQAAAIASGTTGDIHGSIFSLRSAIYLRFNWAWVRALPQQMFESISRVAYFQLAPRIPRQGNAELVTKIHIYSFLLEVLFLLSCFVLTGWYGGIIKFVRGVAYIDVMEWQLRFRSLCLMFMGLPSLIGKVILCCSALRKLTWFGVCDLAEDEEEMEVEKL
ncbi:uncharacterized protein SPPG_05457 [Spizellomyces punctatus DAOM BR117]|uniref:Sulfatase N-terminal domain-containing protein n=1 Tax=Spizellomyces punctatus (strain DAOM BR117) TaxID=645134 RepID=A0A0L0HDJ7_SPIPD|nr:uncharacterized protein SPPG_05457 [Spizellomyces punctatus DAOM BR117]KNC99202.1 hypothetical protein SPPG_05457 [Spizellomyces punctatus DAOM BR117]|eukprot:XP_016607242.1 hypothetical protein SPPG_05457 [Spizellomyces punctatus DAOM BR117]